MKERDIQKWPYQVLDSFGDVVQHSKTARAAANCVIRIHGGRIIRRDGVNEDYTPLIEEAKSECSKRSLESQLRRSRPGPLPFDHPEMRRRRAAAIAKIEAKEKFDSQVVTSKELLAMVCRANTKEYNIQC